MNHTQKFRVCSICNNKAPLRLVKNFTNYFQCWACRTLFSDALDNDNKVGGGNEEPRNREQNYLRIERIDAMIHSPMQKEEVKILDFGCGHGMLVDDLKSAGYINTEGYDAYNEKFMRMPEKNKYHIITCIETIEHTSAPYIEIPAMARFLLPLGVVMIETSFVDVADEDGISLEDFPYIEPSVGHSTLFSHHGLDLLMSYSNFAPMQHCDRHVRLYKKRS